MTYEEWQLEERRLLWEQSHLDTEYMAAKARLHDRWEQLQSHKPELKLGE